MRRAWANNAAGDSCQGGCGESDELGEAIVVLQIVGTNQDRGLRAWVREALRVAFADKRLPWRRDLHEQLVVAHQSDDLLATVERVLTEHLARPHPLHRAQLVEEKINRAL